MVKDFVFIEEGSLDQYNLLKLLENSGMTNDNVIRYKQGSPKPELVSVNNTAEIVSETEKLTIENILCIAKAFLEENTEKIVETNFDMYYPDRKVAYKTIYQGTIDGLMNELRQVIDRHYTEDDNN